MRAIAALGVLLAAGQRAEHKGWVTGLCVLGERVYSCSQAGAFLGVDEKARRVCRPKHRVFAMAARGAAPLMLLGGGRPAKTGELTLLGVAAEPVTKRVAKDLVYGVAIGPRGKRAACALADGRVLVYDLPELSGEREAFRHTAPARVVAFSPSGELLASGGLDRLVQIQRPGSKEKPKILEEHTGEVECLAFSPDGAWLVSGARDGKVRLHTAAGRYVRTWKELRGEVRAVAWHATDKTVYAALSTGAIWVFDAATGGRRLVRKPDGKPLFSLAAVPGGVLCGGRRVFRVAD